MKALANQIRWYFIAIVISGLFCSCSNGKSKPTSPSFPSLAQYKIGFSENLGDYSYQYIFDSTQNALSIITDSVDWVSSFWKRSFLARHDSTADGMELGKYDTVSHYYMFRYCLRMDTLVLCRDSVFDNYDKELTKTKYISLMPITAKSSPAIFNEILQITHDTVDQVTADTLLHINADSTDDRIITYTSMHGESYLLILSQDSANEWKLHQKLQLGILGKPTFISKIKLKGSQDPALFVSTFTEGYVPTIRAFEMIYLLLPRPQ